MKKLVEHIKEMRSFGEFLIPYNYPLVSVEDEEAINCIKQREVFVDGYDLILFFSKADWHNYYLETMQVLGKFSPFLPFSLVCRIGKQFLGNKYLSLVEIFRDNKKIYCWTVAVDKKTNLPIICPYKVELEKCIYDGLEYRFFDSNKVNFY